MEENVLTFSFTEFTQDWLRVAPILGPIVEFRNGEGVQIIDHQEYYFSISEDKRKVSYKPYSIMDRFVISHLRGIANKVSYCFGCKACMVQCPCNAFVIDENGEILIREAINISSVNASFKTQ